MIDLTIRPARPDEAKPILSMWNEFRRDRKPRELALWVWRRAYYRQIQDMLANSAALVATFPEVPDEILGWAVWEMPAPGHPLDIHHIYVRDYVRRRGIGSQLLARVLEHEDPRGFRYSHRTPSGLALLEAHRKSHACSPTPPT